MTLSEAHSYLKVIRRLTKDADEALDALRQENARLTQQVTALKERCEQLEAKIEER